MTITKQIIGVYADECDCLEKYGKIMHNDGGNYHSSTTRYKYTIEDINQEIFVDVTKESRDFYSGDIEDLVLVAHKDGKYIAVLIEVYDSDTDSLYIRGVLCYKDDKFLLNNVSDCMMVENKVIKDYCSGQLIILDSWTTDSANLVLVSLV